jgi:hypothetical protein
MSARGRNISHSFELSRAPLCSSTPANVRCHRALVFLHAGGLASPCACLSKQAARCHRLPRRRRTTDGPAPLSSLMPPEHLCRAGALFFVDAAVAPTTPVPSTSLEHLRSVRRAATAVQRWVPSTMPLRCSRKCSWAIANHACLSLPSAMNYR